MTEKEFWLYCADHKNWVKRGGRYRFIPFGKFGLCQILNEFSDNGIITGETKYSVKKKIDNQPNNFYQYGFFKWSTKTREGNRERRRFCRGQAKLCEG